NRALVGFSHCKADTGTSDCSKSKAGSVKQITCDALATVLRGDAQLRDVSGVGCDQTCERNSRERSGGGIDPCEGGVSIKSSAARILTDMGEDPAGARRRTVLIVDFAVDVAAVGCCNQLRRFVEMLFGPVCNVRLQGVRVSLAVILRGLGGALHEKPL